MAELPEPGLAQRRLAEAGRLLASSLDLPELLDRFAGITRERLRADLVSIWLAREEDEVLTLGGQAGSSRADSVVPLRPERGNGLPGSLLSTGQPVAIEDLAGDVRVRNRAWFAAEGIRSFLGVPLVVEGTAVGVMAGMTRAPRGWSTDDVDSAEALGTLAGVAIRNARLHSAQAALALENGRLLAEAQSHAAALREKNAELDGFVHTVSHDLRAPLVTIQGMAGALLEEHAAGMDPEARRYLGRIEANTQQMERLLLDLLALSRVGREARPPEELPLAELVDEILTEVAELLRTRGIKVVVGDLPSVWAVRVQMEQVVRNLLTNAIRYMGDTASPTIEIGSVGRGADLECWVRDTGIGIDDAYHEKIFEIFQRLKEVEAEGSGVGLAIVKKIVDAAGGRIWVESAPGQGSTFRFTWPARPRRCSPRGTPEGV
jgi:signal transduction histidine kinase